uniref:Uncharacterized protein n=1 Tax=Anguilla anguilla TaxID=7936 RepID=A0A0E9TTL8_ANGAN
MHNEHDLWQYGYPFSFKVIVLSVVQSQHETNVDWTLYSRSA